MKLQTFRSAHFFCLFLLASLGGAHAQVSEGEPSSEWLQLYNTNTGDLPRLYHQNALLIDAGMEAVSGDKAIAGFYEKMKREAGEATSLKSVKKVNASPSVNYEMLKLNTGSGEQLKQLVIWSKAGDEYLRELEIAVISGDDLPVDAGIATARQQWIELCNSHSPAGLVSQLYTPGALYYNHRPLVKGTAAITKEYGYMATPQYNLQLTPIHVEMVLPGLAFELGQCSGSYGGKYMLVWVRNEAGAWQVAFDSNI